MLLCIFLILFSINHVIKITKRLQPDLQTQMIILGVASPYIINTLVQIPYVLFSKIINAESLIEDYYENMLLKTFDLLLEANHIGPSACDINSAKETIFMAFEIRTIDIVLFYNLRRKIIEQAQSIVFRKIDWIYKTNYNL